jgi:hypothetical protein
MVTQMEQLGHALVAISKQHRNGPLETLEQAVWTAAQQALPGLLHAVVTASQRSLQPGGPPLRWACPHCGQRSRVQGWPPRTVRTICGPVTFERPWRRCPGCGHGFSPTDTALALAPQKRLSPGLEGWVVELGARTSFEDAAGLLQRLTGRVVSPETVRQRTEARGATVEGAAEAAAAQVLRTREPAAPVDLAPGRLVVETDGVMVRYRDGWHEVKIGLVGGHVAGKLQATSYTAARASPEAFGPRLLAEAARRGALEVVAWQGSPLQRRLAVLPEVVVLGDGAPWIWNLAAEHFGARVEIVDFYHASEHLWTVAKALYGDTAAAACWATRQVTRLREQGVGPVRAALGQAQPATAEAAEVLRRERGYFRTNAARMAYPRFAVQGLPIGSGGVESSARHVVQQRLKRPGARWSEAGGQRVLNVRCQLLSHQPRAA